ncbi:MAG: glycosyltransferase [Candidatus Omnitrophica bacterium]|nr:glycosyltransferase [Candidatus Omnitrophota bacterium]
MKIKKQCTRIGYILAFEDLASTIVQSQVVDILGEVTALGEQRIYLISFQPVARCFLRAARLAAAMRALKQQNLRALIIPFISIPGLRRFSLSAVAYVQLVAQMTIWLFICSFVLRLKILHCRSYVVALPAILLKKVLRSTVIFDARSPFPEENVVNGKLKKNSALFRMWKHLERLFLQRSDQVVVTSAPFKNHFLDIYAGAGVTVIHNNVDTRKFSFSQVKRDELRAFYGIGAQDVVFGYCGSFGVHINHPQPYIDFIRYVQQLNRRAYFLFVTPQRELFSAELRRQGLDLRTVLTVDAQPSAVPGYLSMCDFGMNLLLVPDVRLSIKTCEYLAVGRPLLVNANALGALYFVRTEAVGLVFAPEKNIFWEDVDRVMRDYPAVSAKAARVVEDYFSNQRVAQAYARLYRQAS